MSVGFMLAGLLLSFVIVWQVVRWYRHPGLIDFGRPNTPTSWVMTLPDIAGNHTQVNGVLAGFSITVVILVATFRLQAKTPQPEFVDESLLGMFLVSFFWLRCYRHHLFDGHRTRGRPQVLSVLCGEQSLLFLRVCQLQRHIDPPADDW